jgi:hypothetical protein
MPEESYVLSVGGTIRIIIDNEDGTTPKELATFYSKDVKGVQFERSLESMREGDDLLITVQRKGQPTANTPQTPEPINITPICFSIAIEKPKVEYPPFETMWELQGDDIKGYAETFYDQAVKAGLPQELIESVIALCREIHNLDQYYIDTFASKDEDLKPLKDKLKYHLHLEDGRAVLPI